MSLHESDFLMQLRQGEPRFWDSLARLTRDADSFEALFRLTVLRKKALARGLSRPIAAVPREKTRVALLGGYSLYPLHELLTHVLDVREQPAELFLGAYDNYTAEIMETSGELSAFRPQVVVLLPSEARCKYGGRLSDPRADQEAAARETVGGLLDLCRTVHANTQAEVILANFMLPARHDLGALRTRTLGHDWTFRKWVNLELGLNAPPFVRILDLEFLSARSGTLAARDPRAWFESKQPCAPALLPAVTDELARLITSLRSPPKKVLVLDLDNTLWGGVVGDDGIEGIEVGDTSPRGEAFKAFQKYVASLTERGVLLAVCSKNDHETAAQPFERHPEMVLRLSDFVSFKASWGSKADSLREMAAELELGLDSFVFVDDNPAEIEMVRQFAPEVTGLLLGPDPADYVGQLADSRLFEPPALTAEDAHRTSQYRSEAQRRVLLASVTDMDSYLASLEMQGRFADFDALDAPRLAQLIGRSNQFNLTTRRRTEAEVTALAKRPEIVAFSFRLHDRFGDHGLISIVVGEQKGATLEIDTWLMSCRVLKRQVEHEMLNELARRAVERGCTHLKGTYLATAKNHMVRAFYGAMGFSPLEVSAERGEYLQDLQSFRPTTTRIKIVREFHEPS
jgi:FkbH-like protein